MNSKIRKSKLKITLTLFLIFILFKGVIFRSIIDYRSIEKRHSVEITNQDLIRTIDSRVPKGEIDLHTLKTIAENITIQNLSFTSSTCSKNPNELIYNGKTNCVGYSTMFNSVTNYIIEKNRLSGIFRATHHVGKLEIFGFDLHQFFSNPFFMDHDFNTITEIRTGTTISVDPTVSDYLRIKRVSQSN